MTPPSAMTRQELEDHCGILRTEHKRMREALEYYAGMNGPTAKEVLESLTLKL